MKPGPNIEDRVSQVEDGIRAIRLEIHEAARMLDTRLAHFERSLNRTTAVLGGGMVLLLLTQIFVLLRLPS